jgi:ATP-dependent DNA helicase MPH1
MGMCYTYLQELSREKDVDENAGAGKAAAASRSKKLRSDPMFQAIMKELEGQRSQGFSVHPKMDLLKTLVVQHFAQNEDVEERTNEETRAMVFVTFREAVDEIVEALNFERPLIRASKFIGQGTDKQGKKGLAQKEQLEVFNG